jgi:pre-mRNA branch site protein p14
MAQYKLPADANRILFVRHLPDAITHDELYELFGRFGAVEQIRLYASKSSKASSNRLPHFPSRFRAPLDSVLKITSSDLFIISCRGRISNPDTRGKAYVVYEDVFDAKAAVEGLAGHNVMGRYITVVFHRPPKAQLGVQEQLEAQRQSVAALRAEVKK